MEYKYDAFISYRHAEKDTLIASEIQKSLERFRIPKAIQKQTGKERFNRIFRDVEELPISSNLTEDLTEALRLSEFLIVICSYRTSESDWVKREIDTFLELHDYNKQLVLTVLVEGEPDEVIPEVLRHDNIIHYLADGTFYCKDEVVEPLAANYRMPISKARKTELPRLAASMLGCNYDDIIRRRKAFRRRRLLIETAIISVAAIALLVYIGWMLMKIQDNLRSAQMNQSRYLATESQRLLEGGDRISALQLAIAALENTDGSTRPITSEAVYALSNALGAYQTWGSSVSSPVWRYEVSSVIAKYKSDNAAKNIAILDTAGKLHVWDRKDHKEKIIGDDSMQILDFEYDNSDNLLLACKGYAALYDSATMTEKWRFNCGLLDSRRDVTIRYYPGKDYLGVNGSDAFYLLNAANGSTVLTLKTDDIQVFKDKKAKTGKDFSLFRFLINSDYSQIALVGLTNKDSYSMFVYDVKNDSWTCPVEDSGEFLEAAFDGENNIMLLRYSYQDSVEKKQKKAEKYELFDTYVILELISSKGKSLWKNEIQSTMRILNTNLLALDYTTKEEKTTRAVLATFSNQYVIAEQKTGKVLKNIAFPGSVVSSGFTKVGTAVTTNVVVRNGLAYFFANHAGSKIISSRRFFPDETIKMTGFKADDGSSSYLVEDASERIVTEFSGRFVDTSFKAVEGTNHKKMGLIASTTSTSNGDIVIAFSNDQKIHGIDVSNNKTIWSVKTPSNTNLIISYSVFAADNKFTYLFRAKQRETGVYDGELLKVNCLTGEIQNASSKFVLNDLISTNGDGGKIYAAAGDKNDTEKFTLYTYDVATEKAEVFPINIKELGICGYHDTEIGVSPDGKKVFVYLDKEVGKQTKTIRLTIDGETGKFTTAECGSCYKVVWNDLGTLFAEANEEGNITVSSADGKERYKIDSEMRMPMGMAFYENRLYVVYNIGVLCSYDSIGRRLMSINLNHGDLKEDEENEHTIKVKFDFVRQYLFVTAGDYTDIINIMDKSSIGYFSGFVGLYNKKEAEKDIGKLKIVAKTFVSDESDRIGSFEYKTVPKMIDQAKEYLKQNGVKMSEDFRKKYGIE